MPGPIARTHFSRPTTVTDLFPADSYNYTRRGILAIDFSPALEADWARRIRNGKHPTSRIQMKTMLTEVTYMQPREASRQMLALLLALMLMPAPLRAQTSPELPDPGKTSLNREQQQQLGLH